jgi:hypothetical protein
MWQRILSFVLVIVVVTATILMFFQGQQECCLCSSFRYHAPCLLDLKTGELRELDMYFPHHSLVAELADPQPEMGTFSFFSFNGVSGTKQTGPERIDLLIPNDKTLFPALCSDCRNQLPSDYESRYVLADLYEIKEKILIPIATDSSLSLRCYDISMEKNIEKGGISVMIQGTLQKEN